MFDNLKDLFRKELQFSHTAGVIHQVGQLVAMIHTQYLKDGDAKNAAIDVLCQMLQSHKDEEVPNAAQ